MRKLSFFVALAVVSLGAAAAHAQWTKPTATVSPLPLSTAGTTTGSAVGLPSAQGALAFTVRTNPISEFFTIGLLVTCLNYPELNGKKNSVITVTFDGNDPVSGEAGSTFLFGSSSIVSAQTGIPYVALGANLTKTYARLAKVPAPASLNAIADQWCVVMEFGPGSVGVTGTIFDRNGAQQQADQNALAAKNALVARYANARINVFAVPRP
jgi:hypothetical protein